MLSARCFITILASDHPTLTLPIAEQARTTLLVILGNMLLIQDQFILHSFQPLPFKRSKNEGQGKAQWAQLSLRTFLLGAVEDFVNAFQVCSKSGHFHQYLLIS